MIEFVLVGFSVEVMQWFGDVRDGVARCYPLVSLLFHLPWLGLAAFEARISARIGRAAEADLIPRPGMRVVGLDRILQQQSPEAADGHLLPDWLRALRLAVVDGLENNFLLQIEEDREISADMRACASSLIAISAEPIGLAIGRHVLVAIADPAIVVEAFVEALEDGDAAVGYAIRLRKDVIEDGAPEARRLRAEIADARSVADAIVDEFARGLVPEGLLRERAVAGIISGLF